MQIHEVNTALVRLGYLDDTTVVSAHLDPAHEMSPWFRVGLSRFQLDANLKADGWYGPKTEGALLPLVRALTSVPPRFQSCRRWLLTTYYVGDVTRWGAETTVPMKAPGGAVIANVSPRAFAEAALEGATKLADGRIVGVASPAYSPADPDVFQPVYDFARKNGWIPAKPGYAGITLTKDGAKVAGARNFEIRRTGPKGWPIEKDGIECDPCRTVAADIGTLPSHDPAFRNKGGVVPVGTRVWILELVGERLPDGSVHDGWCTVNDTGGGIYGAHFDVFIGVRSAMLPITGRAHVWFDGIEQRLPLSYSYGL